MTLKTYRAKTMADALAEVKKDLGRDAVILHTRTYRVGGWMGVGARSVVEITASTDAPADPRQRRAQSRSSVEAPAPAASLPRPAMPAPKSSAVADRFEPSAQAQRPSARPALLPAVTPGLSKAATLAVAATLAPATRQDHMILEEELATIKRLVGQVLQCSRRTAATAARSAPPGSAVMTLGPMTEPLFANYMRLVDAQVGAETAEEVAGAVRDELTGPELADASIVRQTVLRHIAARIPVVGSISKAGSMPDARPLTVALIGPTGVGKTTTVAKLAAAYKLRQGKRVGLVTSDTYRIAAVEQLRTYASIIGLPLRVVLTPAEMSAACQSLSDCDVIIIDTAGRSQHDAGRLDELRDFLQAASPHETSLVLSATAAEPVLCRTAERFGALCPDRAILTKLDEAVHFGVIVNAAKFTSLRLSYVTTGQEVPDQIELAASDRLARTILDGELAS